MNVKNLQLFIWLCEHFNVTPTWGKLNFYKKNGAMLTFLYFIND